MKEVFAHPAQVPFWQAVEAGGPVVWDEVFAGYRSQVDLPGAHVWRELAEAYPQAKVVLTVRPEGSWWTSFSSTIGSLLSRPEPATLPPHVKAMLHVGATFIED